MPPAGPLLTIENLNAESLTLMLMVPTPQKRQIHCICTLYLMNCEINSKRLTSDGLGVGCEHKQLDESEAERGVLMLPDDRWDEEDLSVAGQQQRSEEKSQL